MNENSLDTVAASMLELTAIMKATIGSEKEREAEIIWKSSMENKISNISDSMARLAKGIDSHADTLSKTLFLERDIQQIKEREKIRDDKIQKTEERKWMVYVAVVTCVLTLFLEIGEKVLYSSIKSDRQQQQTEERAAGNKEK